jgi:hypothetical protein
LKSLTFVFLLASIAATLSCGNAKPAPSTASQLAGNWQFTLVRHNSTQQWTFSGFLLQSSNTVTGSFILGAAGCQGVGAVSGTFDGQNLQLTVNALGQDFSLTGGLASGDSSGNTMAGQFSDPAGGCISFSSTGVWTAVRVPALTGSFQGSFVPTSGSPYPTINVTGALTQTPNTGSSIGLLSGTISPTTGSFNLCPYLSNSTISGFISGTTVILNFYGPDAAPVGQLPLQGFTVTLAPDGSSLTGEFGLSALSSTCGLINGTATITFQSSRSTS